MQNTDRLALDGAFGSPIRPRGASGGWRSRSSRPVFFNGPKPDPVKPKLLGAANLAVDLGLLFLSLVAANALSGPGPSAYPALWWFATMGLAVWILGSWAIRHYDLQALIREPYDDFALVSVLVLSVGAALAIVNLAKGQGGLPNLSTFLVVFWASTLAFRFWLFRSLAAGSAPLSEVLIIGTGGLGRATELELTKSGRHKVIGCLNLDGEPRPGQTRASCLGDSSDFEAVIKARPVDEVYIAGNVLRHGEAMQRIVSTCERFGWPFALPAYNLQLHRARPVHADLLTDGYIHFLTSDPNPLHRAIKRLFDIVASAAALWLLMPVLPVVAALIKLTSRGPVLFRQERVGLHGRHFHLLKFRSMVTNAEQLKSQLAKQNEQTGPVFKIKRDPRITKVGRFIRKYSIDELPQLINVLRGEMSVVGPRPAVPVEVAQYQPWQRRRLSVRPGLTCIWQVSGRSQISFEEWMYLDLQYIDHWSLLRDFDLIVKTFPAVFSGDGAS